MLRTPQITRRKRAEEQRTNVVEKPAERLKLRSGERKVGLWIAVLFVLGVAGLSLRMPWRTSPPLARSGVSPSPLAPDGRPALDADAPFAVRSLPGRGKGAIATRDIARGELLIREQPLFRVPNSITISPTVLLHSLLSELTPLDRAAFYNLSFVNMPSHLAPGSKEYEEYLPLAIFQTNAVAAGENMAGIFPRMARLNHGCSYAFNAVYSWREDEGVLVVHALKSIKAGEEILTTYTDTKRVRAERRQTLRDQYAFECQCACCSLPLGQSQRSDARLNFMSELYRAFATWSNGEISGRKTVDIARKIWNIGEEEGYVSERGRLAGDAAYIAAAVQDEDAVRQWARLGELWAGYELGNSSELAKEMRGYAAQPRSHPMWGSAKQKETVGGPADI